MSKIIRNIQTNKEFKVTNEQFKDITNSQFSELYVEVDAPKKAKEPVEVKKARTKKKTDADNQ